MQKALVILGIYAILSGIAVIEIRFKLKKDSKKEKESK